jgi:hypothetical protein
VDSRVGNWNTASEFDGAVWLDWNTGVATIRGRSGIRQNSDMGLWIGILASSTTALFARISWHTQTSGHEGQLGLFKFLPAGEYHILEQSGRSYPVRVAKATKYPPINPSTNAAKTAAINAYFCRSIRLVDRSTSSRITKTPFFDSSEDLTASRISRSSWIISSSIGVLLNGTSV